MATRHAASGLAAVAVVTVLLAPLYLRGLGDADITGDDEAREVALVQDMAERGRWLLPRFNDRIFPDKPPLHHWLAAAACVAAGGCSERAARLPAALAALALVATVGVTAARLFDPAAGVAAAVLLGTTPAFFEHARVARPDVLLTLLLAAALLSFHSWWRTGARSRRRALWIGTWLGLAVLAKGPVAPIVALVTITGFLATRRELAGLRRLVTGWALVPLLILGGGWYAIALHGWGTPFARMHLVGRYLGNVVGGPLAMGVQPSHTLLHHVTFYPLHLLLALLPWTPLVIAALVSIWCDERTRREAALQLLQWWIAATVLVFSFAAFKLRHYLLPALPAAAMLAAPFAAALVRGEPAPGTARTITDRTGSASVPTNGAALALALAVVTVLTVSGVWWWTSDGIALLSKSDRELARALEAAVRAAPGRWAAGALAAAALGTAALHAGMRRRWRTVLALGVASTLAWMLTVQPAIDAAIDARASLKSFALTVKDTVPPGVPLRFFGPILRPIVVYAGRPIPSARRRAERLDRGPGYVIVDEEDLAAFTAAMGERRHRIVAEHVGRLANLRRGRVVLLEVNAAVVP